MPTRDAERLRQIKSFPQLVKYLRDELDWPIEQDSFEDLIFDWNPTELGIDEKNTAKIESISQLRPFTSAQPWGIFFVKFERKDLPIVALRRILGQLAVKKRASGQSADRRTWRADDLLFISAFGRSEERQLTFAHFAAPDNERDLPTLRVLGWDGADTKLKLDHVARELTQHLIWPKNPDNVAEWRTQWSSGFSLRPHEVVRTARDLAVRLADLARGIRDRAGQLLELETPRGPLRKLHAAFKRALIHDLKEADFADMYAQTIAYGLFSAAVTGEGIGDRRVLIAEDLATGAPITNPFLRDLLGSFLGAGGRKRAIDFDELGVQEVVDLLRSPETHLADILRDFGNRTRDEDPVIHFYQSFLAEYDKKLRVKRGVFYTPQPVVSYIVRGIHELLKERFGLEDGLASIVTWREMVARHPALDLPKGAAAGSPFVAILDPATGTATFLVEVIDVIYRTVMARWGAEGLTENARLEKWNAYVPDHLLPRIVGYELMMAPYAIAHMKVGLKLLETGYRFGSKERARIYLTNALEPAQDFSDQLALLIPALAHEAQAVNQVKDVGCFTVVLGNPPYSGHSSNNSPWIKGLVSSYYKVDGKPLGEKNPKWLQDDYVKFVRLAQAMIERTGLGVIGLITNHGFIDNPTFRGMRQQLSRTFPYVRILDLHGNSTKKERSPDGSEDKNIFDIKQGVAVILACRIPTELTPAVEHAHLYGTRETKYATLERSETSDILHASVSPVAPFYVFLPQNGGLRDEYMSHWSLPAMMPVNVLGFQTHRDHFAVDFDERLLAKRLSAFRAEKLTDREVKDAFELVDNRDWNVRDARYKLRAMTDWKSPLIRCLYRPFDIRYCYFSTVAMDYPRRELLDHVLGRTNLCLGVGRQGSAVQEPAWSLVAIADMPIDSNIFRRGGINVFPLYLYPRAGELNISLGPELNFAKEFLRTLGAALQIRTTAKNGMPSGMRGEDVVHYAYAILHSKTYRHRYAEFLKSDFPRIPLPRSKDLFDALATLGAKLTGIHLKPARLVEVGIGKFMGSSEPVVEQVRFDDNAILIGSNSRFEAVPNEVWEFQIGGFRVCEKWLKDRRGRVLSTDDIRSFRGVLSASFATLRMAEGIEKVISEYGGWAMAFAPQSEYATQSPLARRVAERKVK